MSTLALSQDTPVSSSYPDLSAVKQAKKNSLSLEVVRTRIYVTINHIRDLERSHLYSEMELTARQALDDPSLTPLERGSLLVEQIRALLLMKLNKPAQQQIIAGESPGLPRFAEVFKRFRTDLESQEGREAVLAQSPWKNSSDMRITVYILIEHLESLYSKQLTMDMISNAESALEDPSLNSYERARLISVYAKGLFKTFQFEAVQEMVEEGLALNIPCVNRVLLVLKDNLTKHSLGSSDTNPYPASKGKKRLFEEGD